MKHAYIWERSVDLAVQAADFIAAQYETDEAEVVNFVHGSEDRIFVYFTAKSSHATTQIVAEWRRIQRGTSTKHRVVPQ